jgi:hypothetical protein
MELGYHLLKCVDDRPAAVDLGAGSGRNSLFLCSLGFDVLAIEHDYELAARCSELLKQSGYAGCVTRMNAAEFSPQKKIDLCLCLGILHFLELDDAKSLVLRLKSQTQDFGFHVLTIADRTYNSGRHNTFESQGFLGSVSADQVSAWYDDWRLLAYERYTKTDDHLGGSLDEHVIEKFVFTPLASTDRCGTFPRILRLRPDKTPSLESQDLHRLVRLRASWEQLKTRLGSADFEIVSSVSTSQLSTVPSLTGSFDLRVAFWGALKLYFENNKLVGFSLYQTDAAHSFTVE